MKKIIVLFLMCFYGFAQDSTFTFTKNGFTDFVVTEVSGKTQQDLFKKAVDWVSFTYKNPNEVLKAKIDNDYIRVSGASSKLICINSMMNFCYDTRYDIEISFKEGKYKFDLTKLEYYVPGNQYGPGGWFEYQLTDMKEYFKENGDPKGRYKKNIPEIIAYFNKLNSELEAFLKSSEIPTKKKDW